MNLSSDFKFIQEYIVKARRELHKIPEIGKHLPLTSEFVVSELEKMGVKYRKNINDSGVVAIIEGKNSGKTIALRADMDGLPIKEENTFSFKSTNQNMHACGHDAHTAMLLGAIKILNDSKEFINGNIKFLFQTGEETCEGAKVLIEEGALENPKVDALLGLHIGSLFKEIGLGQVGVFSGSIMAAYDRFTIRIKGLGCHGATPETGVDPILISTHIISALQTIISREKQAIKPAVISICKIHAGNSYNIIPDYVDIEGTIRTVEESQRKYVIKRIEEIANGIAISMGGNSEFKIYLGAPPVVNDLEFTENFKKVAVQAIGEDNVISKVAGPSMGGEDVAFYLEKIPGTFFFLGSHNEKKNIKYPHHNPKFDLDEDVMWIGTELLVKGALNFLNN